MIIRVASSGLTSGPCPCCAGTPELDGALQMGSHQSGEGDSPRLTCCPHCFGCPGYNLLSEPLCLLQDLQFSPSPPEWPDHSCSLTAASHFTFPSPLLLLLSLSLLHLRKYLPYSEYFQFFFLALKSSTIPTLGKGTSQVCFVAALIVKSICLITAGDGQGSHKREQDQKNQVAH